MKDTLTEEMNLRRELEAVKLTLEITRHCLEDMTRIVFMLLEERKKK